MEQQISDIKKQLATIVLPNTTETLTDTYIKKIELNDGKLNLALAIPRSRDKAFQTFQKSLLKLLKIDLGIEGVTLEFEQASSTAQAEPIQQTYAKPNSRYLSIVSGKGGVGKSTVTVGLAKALQAAGKKVAIIDADIYGASIPQILNMSKTPPQIQGLQVKPYLVDNIEVISSSLLIPENKPVMWKGPMLSKMLTQFFTDIAWSDDIDFFLLDMPPGTGDILIELGRLIPHTKMLVVTTPQEDAAYVATKAGFAALDLEHQILGVIENMSYVACVNCDERNYVYGRGGGYYVAEALGTECLAEIPLQQDIPTDAFDSVVSLLVDNN